MTDPAVDALLGQVALLAGTHRVVTSLGGGLTNRNYRVQTDAVDCVVRVSTSGAETLGVDREREHANSIAAAAAGVGAPVLDYRPDLGLLVVGFIPSRTFTPADVRASLPRVAAALRRLHAGPVFSGRFDMLALQRTYAATVAAQGLRVPDGYAEAGEAAARVAAALAEDPEPLVPCHNDLLAANLLDDGETLHIIDYEYSGMNESAFELGNLAQENALDDDELAALVAAYDQAPGGEPDPRRVARARLWAIYAGYGWTLWGVIQAATSDLDADFWGFALERWEPAREAFASGVADRLVATLRGAA